MQYSLRKLLIALAIVPPLLAAIIMVIGGGPVNPVVVAVAAYAGLVAILIMASRFAETEVANPHYESQVETFDRQTKESDRLMALQERTLQRGEALMTKQEAATEQIEKLLHTLGEQAKRKDAILDAEERKLGIKV